MITRKFEFFSGGWGTSKDLNLKGRNKANFLDKEFGKQNFEYIGDCSADIPIWQISSASHLVTTSESSPLKRA